MHVLAIILLGRTLRPQMFGVFELALGILSYVLLAVQQGFDVIAIREVARNHKCLRNWVIAVLQVRVTLALVAGVGIAGWTAMTGWHHPLGFLLIIFAGSLLANALTIRWSFLALGQPGPPAIASAISQAFFLGAVVFEVKSPDDFWKAAVGWVVGEFCAAIFLWTQRRPAIKYAGGPAVSSVRLLREALPVTVSLFLGQTMYNFDVLALAALGKSDEIGLYLASYRCATGFAPLLGHFQASILPQFARDHAEPAVLMNSARRIALAAALAGLAIAIVVVFEAAPIIDLLFGPEYRMSAPYLRLLVLALPFQFPRAVFRQALFASNQQASDTRNTAFGALTSVTLDVALVPSWGAFGCSVSSLCSEFVLLVCSWHALERKRSA